MVIDELERKKKKDEIEMFWCLLWWHPYNIFVAQNVVNVTRKSSIIYFVKLIIESGL